MAAVLAGEAASARARLLAPALALACLLFPASAAAQLPDVGATAGAVVNTATRGVAQPTAPAQPVVEQTAAAVRQASTPPPASGPVERATAPVKQVVERVHHSAEQVPEAAARSVEQATAPVRQAVAGVRERIDQTVAVTHKRVRQTVATVGGPGRLTLAPTFQSPEGPLQGRLGELLAPRFAFEPFGRPGLPAPTEMRWVGASSHTPNGGSGVTGVRQSSPTPKPGPSGPELPSIPSGGASAAPAGLMFAGLLALFGAAALMVAGAARRLHVTPAALRPAPFISLLERPG